MGKPPPDRGKAKGRQVQALNMVRGGAVCDPKEKGGHILKGSGQPAVCMPTASLDPRPRYRQAGKAGEVSRHSQHFLQHRKGGKPYGR
jgi:hypothetical protein